MRCARAATARITSAVSPAPGPRRTRPRRRRAQAPRRCPAGFRAGGRKGECARARPIASVKSLFTNCFFHTTGRLPSVRAAQHLKPGGQTHVNRRVKHRIAEMKPTGANSTAQVCEGGPAHRPCRRGRCPAPGLPDGRRDPLAQAFEDLLRQLDELTGASVARAIRTGPVCLARPGSRSRLSSSPRP